MQAKAQLVGRDEVLSQIAAMVHTFAYNHRAFNSTYLNFALLGPPGTGKTTIARTIGMIFQQLGIVLSKKFDIVAREDLVGGVIGETATKTRGVLNDHLEGTLMIDVLGSIFPGDTMVFHGVVTDTGVDGTGCGWVAMDISVAVDGDAKTTCTARVALPVDSSDNPWERKGDRWQP
jgi:Ni2+-binding GTPase involved in maturation of urease and hydrogenase